MTADASLPAGCGDRHAERCHPHQPAARVRPAYQCLPASALCGLPPAAGIHWPSRSARHPDGGSRARRRSRPRSSRPPSLPSRAARSHPQASAVDARCCQETRRRHARHAASSPRKTPPRCTRGRPLAALVAAASSRSSRSLHACGRRPERGARRPPAACARIRITVRSSVQPTVGVPGSASMSGGIMAHRASLFSLPTNWQLVGQRLVSHQLPQAVAGALRDLPVLLLRPAEAPTELGALHLQADLT